MTMTLIEGVGDEVTLFFVLALLSVIACLAWWTTRVTDRPLRIQTIIVGQRVIHVDERGEPTTAEAAAAAAAAEAAGGGAESQPAGAESAEPEPSCEEDEDGEVELVQSEERSSEDVVAEDAATGVAEDGQVASEGDATDSAAVSEGTTAKSDAAPQHSAVESEPVTQSTAANIETVSQATAGTPAQDGAQLEDNSSAASVSVAAAAAMEPASAPEPEPIPDAAPDARQQLRHRRLAFMARQATGSGTPAASDVPDGATPQRTEQDMTQRTEPDTAERTTDTARTADTAGAAQAAAPTEGAQTITVKLKFLNDTQRLAEGRRTEPLADFKRRHFPAETAANRIVRLIFNGRVLPDQETLSQCGLYHNCVVHCHVSANPRPPPAGAAAGGAAVGGAGGGGGGGGGAPHELDIGVLLYPVLTSVVTLVWGLRLRYPELFSGTAVILLAALTLLLACFAAATFFPLERLPMAQAAMAAGARQQQRGR